MKPISTIVFAICTAVSFAAVADTNVIVATEKCQPVASANAIAASGDAVFERAVKAELKAAANDAKAEYEKRYEALERSHDRFMLQLNISLGIIAALVTIFGAVLPIIMQWRAAAEINRKEEEIDKRIDDSVLECRNVASRVKESTKEETDQVLQVVWKTQVITTHQALESTLNACKYSNWAYSRACHSNMIQEILSVLKWLSYVTDRPFAKSHFRKLATDLKMFRDNTRHIPEWQCKEENVQTSDVRINLELCAKECEDDYKLVQEVLYSLGIKVLDIDC